MPTKFDCNYFRKSFDFPNPGLRAYFGHVREGQPDVYRTPFYHGKSMEQILAEWSKVLDTISNDWPSLLEFENDLGKKVGPMSVMKPLSERLTDIDSYYESILKDSSPVHPSAIKAALREWSQINRLTIRGLHRTVELMKKSTNSGSPYFTKRKRVLNKTIPCELYTSSEGTLQTLPGGTYNACAVLGWRGQEGGPSPDDVKQRVVWMFPFAVNAQELRVYQPLIETAQRYDVVPAWISMEAVDKRITDMFDTKGADDVVICTDFSKFDQHFNPTLQAVAKEMLQTIFSNDAEFKVWSSEVFPIKYEIPLAFDWDHVRFGKHGMGSGSGGTNADETLVHRALQYEAAINNGQRLNPNSQCLGDDGVLTYPGCTAEDVMRSYTSHGLDMNPDKQYVSKHDCVYLRRWHHDKYRVNNVCVGVYSTYRALGRLCMQERYYDPEVWGPKMVALRQLSIIENVKYHPLREQFADYCMKGDKFRLGLDIPGFLDNINKIAQEAIDYMPDFLGYTKSLQGDGKPSATGLDGWWIVQYLKSKR